VFEISQNAAITIAKQNPILASFSLSNYFLFFYDLINHQDFRNHVKDLHFFQNDLVKRNRRLSLPIHRSVSSSTSFPSSSSSSSSTRSLLKSIPRLRRRGGGWKDCVKGFCEPCLKSDPDIKSENSPLIKHDSVTPYTISMKSSEYSSIHNQSPISNSIINNNPPSPSVMNTGPMLKTPSESSFGFYYKPIQDDDELKEVYI